MKFKFLLFGFLIYSISTLGQGLMQGTITSIKGDTLPYANLMLYQDSVFIAGVSTDAKGYYSIDVTPGLYDLKLSYIGFEDLNIQGVELSETQALDLDLELKAGLSLPEIVVLANNKEFIKCTYMCSSSCGMQCYIETSEEPIQKKESDILELKLYPNPAVGQVSIKTNQTFSSLHIFSVTGQLIRTITNIESGNNTINISGLIPGTYLLRFQEGKSIITKKLIVKNNL